LARLGGDAGLLQELAELFLAEYPRSLAQLHEALRREDPKDLQNVAHGLKGAIANFAAQPAYEAAVSLETLGREARLMEAPAALAALEEALGALRASLERGLCAD
jgi:HPt (histidine-containing phosphotransfer) domain-containing protein